MRTTLAFLLLTTLAVADKPTPTITGPHEVHSGALVTLDAGDSAGAEAFGWLVDTSKVQVPDGVRPDVTKQVSELQALGFEVIEPETDDVPLYEVEDGGKRLRLSSYPGVYRVTLGVSNADGVAMLEWLVTVGGVKPPDPPTPPVPPDPPGPDLTAFSRSIAAAVQPMAQAHGEFEDVANVYESVSSMAAAGAITSPDEMVSTTASLTRAKLKSHLSAWTTVVTQVIGPHLNQLSSEGKLETPQAHVPLWNEIAAGIRKGIE